MSKFCPQSGSAIVGFPLGTASGTIRSADTTTSVAQNDAHIGFSAMWKMPSSVDLTGQDQGGQTLPAGVYLFTESAQVTGALTLDARGNANATFVFQVRGRGREVPIVGRVGMTDAGCGCIGGWDVCTSVSHFMCRLMDERAGVSRHVITRLHVHVRLAACWLCLAVLSFVK